MKNLNRESLTKTWPDAWLQTFTGKAFYPLEPDIDLIDIEDIANALAHQCRYAGHTNRFYSVAEHSLHLANYAPIDLKLWALLHDASEAYLVDIPRPLKGFISNYKGIECQLMNAIAQRFELGDLPEEIKRLDTRILHDESRVLMSAPPMDWDIPGEPLGIEAEIREVEQYSCLEIKTLFLEAFAAFGGKP